MPPKHNNEITEDTRVPLKLFYVVLAFLLAACVTATIMVMNINANISYLRQTQMTQPQFQAWLDDFREQNLTLKVPRLPQAPSPSPALPFQTSWKDIVIPREDL